MKFPCHPFAQPWLPPPTLFKQSPWGGKGTISINLWSAAWSIATTRLLEEIAGEDARGVTLAALVPGEKFRFLYEYDFGDAWEHELLIEKGLLREAEKSYPVCLTGKRACPPEDCGGIWGYGEFLAALADPTHPEHDAMLEWVGGAFDPDTFDREEVNAELQRLT